MTEATTIQAEPRRERVIVALVGLNLILLLQIRSSELSIPWVCAALLLSAMLAIPEVLRRWRVGALGALVFPSLLLAWVTLGTLLSRFPVEAAAQTGLVANAVLLAIATGGSWSSQGLRSLLLSSCVLALGYACWALWLLQQHGATGGLTRDVNNVALSACLGGMVSFALLRRAGNGGVVAGGLLAVALVFLLMGGLGARAVSLVLLLALALRAVVDRDRIAALWLCAALAGAAAVVLWPSEQEASASVAASGAALGRAVDQRDHLFEAAFDLLRDAPLFGHGLMSFHFLFELVRDPSQLDLASMVHNDYLQLGAELGLPAVLALGLLAVALLLAWFSPRRDSSVTLAAGDAPLVPWLALALLGMFGHALVNFPFYDPFLLAQFALMAGVALRAAPRLPSLAGAAAPLLCAAGLLATGVLAVRLLLLAIAAAALMRQPVLPGLDSPALAPAQQLAVATSLRPFAFLGGVPDFAIGRVLARSWAEDGRRSRPLAEQARDAFGAAAEAEPWVTDYAVQYARMQRETGATLAERERTLQRTMLWQPRDPLLYLALAVHRLQEGDRDGAIAVASRRWLPWCAHEPRPGAREHADLLALAGLDDAPAVRREVSTCVEALRARGHEPGDGAEVLARFGRSP